MEHIRNKDHRIAIDGKGRHVLIKFASNKTKMGALKNGFHFLGVNFAVSRNQQGKIQTVTVSVHPRTPRRALDKVISLTNDAVNPAKIQRYLSLWARWWQNVVGKDFDYFIGCWIIPIANRILGSQLDSSSLNSCEAVSFEQAEHTYGYVSIAKNDTNKTGISKCEEYSTAMAIGARAVWIGVAVLFDWHLRHRRLSSA